VTEPAARPEGGRRVAGDLPRSLRIVSAVVFLLVSVVGWWRSQAYVDDALVAQPGVWPSWAFWPGLVLLVLLLTQLPRRGPRWTRTVVAVVSLAAFGSSAVVGDALAGRFLLAEEQAVVRTDEVLPRAIHHLRVASGGREFTAYSPAAAFAGGQQGDPTTGTRNYAPGPSYGSTGSYAVGAAVTVRLDPDRRWYTRVVPAPGQPGYLPLFPRRGASLAVAGVALALGWLVVLAAVGFAAGRGPLRRSWPRRKSPNRSPES